MTNAQEAKHVRGAGIHHFHYNFLVVKQITKRLKSAVVLGSRPALSLPTHPPPPTPYPHHSILAIQAIFLSYVSHIN